MTIAKGEKCFYESKTNCDDGYVNCDVCGPRVLFRSTWEILKITLDSLPIIVGAALLGPLDGFLIGFFGSFLNQLLTFGLTPTTIIWVLPAAIRGLLIGVYPKHCHFDMSFLQTQIITEFLRR